MSGDSSGSCGPERDLLRNGPAFCLLWIAPWLVFALGFGMPRGTRTVLWAASLGVMSAACFFNSIRCGRVHCRFTGPFFLAAAVVTIADGLGLLPFGPNAWKWIGFGTVAGAVALCCLPELVLGRYRPNRKDA